jgi:outer membrane protein OmpA-like peptidoglycan-associated protein
MSYTIVAKRTIPALLAIGLASLLYAPPALAQQPKVSADQIIEALSPPPLTRGLTGPSQPPVNEADRSFVNGLRGLTRSLSASERERVYKIASEQKSPDVNLEIYFDFNSAKITPKAEPQITALGEALRRGSQLQSSLIMLSGHTDATGGDDYNQKLSERRAEAVKAYLVSKFQIPEQNLSTAGYGERNLKNAAKPNDGENRRVQIVNLQPATEASRR